MKKNKKKRNTVQKFKLFFMVLSIIGIVVWGAIYAVNYTIGEDEEILSADGTKVETTKKKDVINALVCGINENLTDTMIYVRYDVNSGKIAMMSIPRDTYVTNDYCIGHKLNAIYRGKNVVPLVEEIQELLDVKIDYYLIFDTEMVHELVDAVGGVEIEVPMRMKYDDPTQNLHIDLQKGLQVLNGKQAEMFVRFRHNNDMTVGYSMGDLDRTKVQQTFIKTFAKTALSASNIPKYPELIKIALEHTDTNVTVREALKYATDAAKIDVENIISLTAPGEAKYIDNLSYFVLDEDETRKVIKEQFNTMGNEDVSDTTKNSDDVNKGN